MQEAQFIQTCIKRERRIRTQFELSSPKKRGIFFNRLCHRYHELLDMRFLHEFPKTATDSSSILAHLMQHQATETCYVMALRDELDARYFPLAVALKLVVGNGLPCIVLSNEGNIGYFEAEQELGAPPRYLLKRM